MRNLQSGLTGKYLAGLLFCQLIFKRSVDQNLQPDTQNSNQMKPFSMILLLTLVSVALSQRLYIHSPAELSDRYKDGVKVHLSPLGFHPQSGQLDGIAVNANPLSACSVIEYVQNSEQDVFVMADDATCFESTKAKNIMKGGGLVGLIKQNVNTTLHDKDVNVVHIAIAELGADDFDEISAFMSNNPSAVVSMSLQFSQQIAFKQITTEIWMTPTETKSYKFLIDMEHFLNNEANEVEFKPRYAMHSQKQRKTFIGCYSDGMYCPGEIQYDGKMEGQNIMEESLRQIVIRQMGLQMWWQYIKYYYVQCLHNTQGDVMLQNKALQTCSKNSMMLAGIDPVNVAQMMNQSFAGSRKEVDDNVLLREERQDFIRQKITNYPVLLINKKEYHQIDTSAVQSTICKMEHVRSAECSKLLNGDLENSEVYIIVGVVLIIVVLILVGYRIIMHRRMQKEMKGEVTSTLEQYYRYMDTLEGENSGHLRTAPSDSGHKIDHPMTRDRQNVDEMQVEIQMSSQDHNQKREKPTKEGHTTLVEDQN